jgi:hypothetical protein
MRIVETRINLLVKNREKGSGSRAVVRRNVTEDEIDATHPNDEEAG